MSFNPHSVAAFAAAAPERARGITTCGFDGADWSLPDYRRAELAAIPDVARTGAAFVSHDRRDLASPAVARLRAAGLPILTWTIRSPAEEAEARRIADNITFESYRPAMPDAPRPPD
jgi:glycerophosphoryl diester phosphodiesterase